MVLNDEGHHAYRPAPVSEEMKLTAEEKADREEATVWVSGLDKINAACGISICVDMSATPFYIHGSGYPEGSPFPWIVSDFSLVDAIESGITKIPRLPAIDNTGRPDPKYFKLWEHITRDLKAGEKLNGGKPKPEVVYRKAEDALLTLAGEWKQKLDQVNSSAPGQERTPPVMIVVCDNTDIAKHFYQAISGEELIEADVPDERKRTKTRPRSAGRRSRRRRSTTARDFRASRSFGIARAPRSRCASTRTCSLPRRAKTPKRRGRRQRRNCGRLFRPWASLASRVSTSAASSASTC